MKVHVRKNNAVVVISGKDKGRTGRVLRIISRTGKVVVKGANLVKEYQKSNRQNMQGGTIETEAVINSSKVMLFYEECKKATRISHKLLEDGVRVGACKKYEEAL